MCLKKLILTKPVAYVSVLFVITCTFLREILDFNQKYAVGVMI